jgi:hypothetical protein
MTYRTLVAAFVLASLIVLSAAAGPSAPEAWIMAGSAPASYELGVDPNGGQARGPAGFLKSKSGAANGFGTMMQQFSADDYRGKRVRFSAAVRSEEVKTWAGLWMRVDDKGGRTSAFDNMQKRPIRGTTGWERHDVVLDVGPEANLIALGVLLAETGQVWIDQVRFEVVPESVAATGSVGGQQLRAAPANLDFRR